MSPGEVAWRARRAVAAGVEGRIATGAPAPAALAAGESWRALYERFRRGEGRPLVLTRARAAELAQAEPARMDSVVAAADRARAGRVAYFGYPEVTLNAPIDWSLDPIRGHRWPERPGARIDYRSEPADPKWIWELNRLQDLLWLAQGWLVTGEERYADTALERVEGWICANPPGRGIAWRGGFEAGIRAISVALALQGLREAPALTPDRFAGIVGALAAMARRAWRERSLHSSANNHLVGELAGMATVALMLPELREAPAWRRQALSGLAREGARQVLPDGAGAEQAFDYQVFTGDLLLVVATLAGAAGRPVPRGILGALHRGAGYLAGLLGDGEPEPRYGDADDGFALRLDADARRDPRGHLGAVAALLGHADARRPGHLDLTARWLTGREGERRFAATVPASAPGSFVAPAGGLVVMRHGARRVTMDTGPLGFLAIAAHGHADALAVTIADGGRALVDDPGAASYFGHPDWRRAHRSTSAHATVAVDGRDQSEPGGAFMWSAHARARLLHADLAAGYAVAEHDGYRRLADPVRHRRHLLAPPGEPVLVLDLLEAAGAHEYATAWPLHPDLGRARPEGGGHGAGPDGGPAIAIAHASSAPGVRYALYGDEASALGWWSDRLESRRPAALVGLRVAARGRAAIATWLAPGRRPAPTLALDLQSSACTMTVDGGSTRSRVTFNLLDLTCVPRIEVGLLDSAHGGTACG